MAFLDYTGLTSFWEKVKDILSGKQNSLVAGDGVFIESDTVSVQEPVKEITQAQYDALTDEEKNKGLYVVTDATINLNDHGDIYSTDETRIGIWIDGKPAYRRVFSFPLPDTGDIKIDNTEIQNLDQTIKMGAVILGYGDLSDVSPYMLPYNGNAAMVYYDVARNGLCTYCSDGNFVGHTINVVIKYTKTTDSVPAIASLSTQSVQTNELEVESVSPERVLTSQVPLPSYVQYAPASASASSVKFSFAKASASSARFTFSPASASSASLTL